MALSWQPSLLAEDPPVRPRPDRARAARPRLGRLVRHPSGLGARWRRPVRHARRVGPVGRPRAPDVRPHGGRAAAHDAAWDDPPEPVPAMAAALSRHYGCDLTTVSANLYRDGRDSVAWHGDRVGRRRAEAVVAIVSLGAPAPVPAAAQGRRAVPAADSRQRRPAGAGRDVPAHVGALGAQVRHRRPAHQRDVPRGLLTRNDAPWLVVAHRWQVTRSSASPQRSGRGVGHDRPPRSSSDRIAWA